MPEQGVQIVVPVMTYNLLLDIVPAKKVTILGINFMPVVIKTGGVHSFDLSPAHIHDLHYLKAIKHLLSNCLLIGDRGYISADYQSDLFTESHINLSIPMRKNQRNFVPFSKEKVRIRKPIETNFSQLHGQFSWTINHAKSFLGLATSILSKITAFTMIQYFDKLSNPI